MLTLPPFVLHRPTTLPEAIALLARHGASVAVIAGGTDLLPNMKHGLTAPRHVVSLRGVAELAAVREDPGSGVVSVGAMTTLDALAEHDRVRAVAPALAEAAAAVGGPHHRRMGTLGGNLCLDTRCQYYNQSEFWRDALGYCLKKDGLVCHVVPGGTRCVAAASNDTAAAAIACDLEIELVGPRGRRVLPAGDFFTADGVRNTVRDTDELLVAVRIPRAPGRRSAYEKLRLRGAIDFPLLSVAARADLDGDRIAALDIVVSALTARPKRLACAGVAIGRSVADVAVSEIAEGARRECKPLENIPGDAQWRREMVPVLVARALRRALGAA